MFKHQDQPTDLPGLPRDSGTNSSDIERGEARGRSEEGQEGRGREGVREAYKIMNTL